MPAYYTPVAEVEVGLVGEEPVALVVEVVVMVVVVVVVVVVV
mgnify:CR=1 FL=1